MLGMFCGTDITTNEGFKKHIKQRILTFIGILVIGIATIFISYMAKHYWTVSISENIMDLYSGFGTSLFIVATALLVKNILILKDEAKLRKARITNTDERNKQVSVLATRVALAVMLVVIYAVMLVGGLWYPILTVVLSTIVCIFLLTYCIAYMIISKKI